MAFEAEFADKQRRVTELMDREQLDAIVMATTANFAWFTCGGRNYVGTTTEIGSAAIVITRKARFIVCDNIEAPRIRDEEITEQGYVFLTSDWYDYSRNELIAMAVGEGCIGADVPVPGAKDVSGSLDSCRSSLTSEEVTRYRLLGDFTGQALRSVAGQIRPGMTESNIAAVLESEVAKFGAVPTVNLVAVDDRISAYRHPLPTEKKLERIALLVIGARKWGLIVSASRMVSFGPLDEELRRRHDAVCRVDTAMISATKPGAAVGDVFRSGMRAYSNAGFADEWKLHHQGGPTGYKGRDYRANSESSAIIQPNQAFAWNPSITGTKSEDTIIATASGPEIISDSPGWPMVEVEIDETIVRRPDILVR